MHKQIFDEAKQWLMNNPHFTNNNSIEIEQDEDNNVYLYISERYEDETTLSKSDFIDLIDELKSAKIDPHRIETQARYIYSLDFCDNLDYVYNNYDFDFEDNEISISIIKPDAFILISYIKYLECSSKYFNSVELPLFIEVILENKGLSNTIVENKLNSYLFERSNKFNLSISIAQIGTLRNLEYDYLHNAEAYELSHNIVDIPGIRYNLKQHNPLMQNFVNAIGTPDLELQFLGFFKILEHCGTKLAHQHLYNNLKNEIIQDNNLNKPDHLQEVISIVNQAKNKQYMENILLELIKLEELKFCECINYLPNKLNNTPNSNICKKLTAIRNAVCHDKANYHDKENVSIYMSNEEDFRMLNSFMKEFSYRTINWYTEHFEKLTLKAK